MNRTERTIYDLAKVLGNLKFTLQKEEVLSNKRTNTALLAAMKLPGKNSIKTTDRDKAK